MDIEVSSEMELTAKSVKLKASEEIMAQEETLTMSEVLPDIVIKTGAHVLLVKKVSVEPCTEESCDSWQEKMKMKMMDDELRSIERPFKYLLNKAKDFQRLLVCRRDYLQNECFARVVPTFLHICQPLFSYLESTAAPCPSTLTYALDISHFFMGQCQIGSMTMSIFRYCQPTPYLAGVNTGLFKRMRWNVKRPQERPPQQQQQ